MSEEKAELGKWMSLYTKEEVEEIRRKAFEAGKTEFYVEELDDYVRISFKHYQQQNPL